ncbi:MAG: class II fructose-1,6-bisphosphate aldolase [bacterium]|nr:class II fructose-1,6-bisphosphate aldolase [bacterium]
MLVTSGQLLKKAYKGHYAVPAFNINNLEVLQGIMESATKLRSPIIIQTSEGAIEYAGMDFLYAMVTTAAKKYPIAISLHLDHGKNLKTIKQCIAMGWTSVMFDGSALPYKENLSKTQQVVKWAHAKGISVEAELGAIKGKEDTIDIAAREAFFTDPVQATQFVNDSDIDILAISIGTAHGPFKFENKTILDFKRLSEIKKNTHLPLVLHGASGIPHRITDMLDHKCSDLHDCGRVAGAHGVSDTAIKKAIKLGINKINIDSDLRLAFTAGMRNALLAKPHAYDPRDILSESRDLVAYIVAKKIALFGSARKS